MSRWSALDTQFNLPEALNEPLASSGLSKEAQAFPVFGIAIFMLVVVGLAIAISLTGAKKPAPEPVEAQTFNLIEPRFASEDTLAKTVDLVEPEVENRVYAKKSSSIWFDVEDSIPEPFVHTEKGHTFQEYAQTLDSGRPTYQVERPDGLSANLDYLKQDLKKKGLGLNDFVESFGVSVSDSFVDSWSKSNEKPTEKRQNMLSTTSDMSESEMRQLAQEAMQSVPLTGNPEAIAAVLREILAARTEAKQVGLDLGPIDPAQRSAIESFALGKTKASSIAQTILSRL